MSYQAIALTASTTLSAFHSDAPITFSTVSGGTLTLPAATGSGLSYDITLTATITSNSLIVRVASASDIMAGVAWQAADGGSTVNAWETAADSDTITLNGGTTGGIKGDNIKLRDIGTGLWSVTLSGAATGTEATPFSAAVS